VTFRVADEGFSVNPVGNAPHETSRYFILVNGSLPSVSDQRMIRSRN
jgi:hypothetical protein